MWRKSMCRNLKRSFICPVIPTVYTYPSRKWSFLTTLLNRRNLKTPAFCFRVDEKHFENVKIIMWFPWKSFPRVKSPFSNSCESRLSKGHTHVWLGGGGSRQSVWLQSLVNKVRHYMHGTLDLQSGKSLSSLQSSGRANRQEWNTSRRNSCKATHYPKHHK